MVHPHVVPSAPHVFPATSVYRAMHTHCPRRTRLRGLATQHMAVPPLLYLDASSRSTFSPTSVSPSTSRSASANRTRNGSRSLPPLLYAPTPEQQLCSSRDPRPAQPCLDHDITHLVGLGEAVRRQPSSSITVPRSSCLQCSLVETSLKPLPLVAVLSFRSFSGGHPCRPRFHRRPLAPGSGRAPLVSPRCVRLYSGSVQSTGAGNGHTPFVILPNRANPGSPALPQSGHSGYSR